MNRAMNAWPDDDVILYDGVCVFCSRWIRFIAARDKDRRFRFTAIQSPYGTRLARAFGIDPQDPDTNAVIHGGVAWFKSDAALTVLSQLPGWGWVRALRAVPKPLRDALYNLVARNRYRIFGKYEECFVPGAGFRDRVME
jgi:predicted DCC family thiol-disulfide oxidoreductase YuxK